MLYATARSIETLQDLVALAPDRIMPIALDVTDPAQVNAAAQTAQDVTLLINSASKAALNSLTQDIRADLAAQGKQVVGVFPDPLATAMTEGLTVDKAEPIDVAQAVLQAVEAGLEDVYPDPVSQSAFAAISEPLKAVEKMFAGWMPQ